MCGIIGITGTSPALADLLDGLARLEYRGYDSVGVALADGATTRRVRVATGTRSLEGLRAALDGSGSGVRAGIGHTRWATHGAPSEANAHPHADCTGELAVVHNGIIENHAGLRAELAAAGHRFTSETDSEVVAHLVEQEIAEQEIAAVGPGGPGGPAGADANAGSALAPALRRALARIRGSFAIAAIRAGEPDLIVGARRVSPLIVGLGPERGYLASDIPALLGLARELFVLGDDQVAEVRPGRARVTDAAAGDVAPEPLRVDWDLEAAQRGGYESFMLKEIHEQPGALAETLRGRLDPRPGAPVPAEAPADLEHSAATLVNPDAIDRVVLVACGTSLHAAQVARTCVESWMGVPADVDIASEFRYRDPPLGPGTLVIAVSQSGETTDTVEAAREARRRGSPVLAVTNVVGSSMARDASAVVYTRAGPEIGVAATKTFVTQIAALELVVLRLAAARGALEDARVGEVLRDLGSLPSLVEVAVSRFDEYADVARACSRGRNYLFLGRQSGYPVALEGALKLKEIAYVHAEGYPAGEMKHGPIALIEPGTVVVAVATRDAVWDKIMGNVEEARARGATVVLVADDGDEETASQADRVLRVPHAHPFLAPVVDVVPLQVFAYVLARERGHDVDRPRNLAKTVTVE